MIDTPFSCFDSSSIDALCEQRPGRPAVTAKAHGCVLFFRFISGVFGLARCRMLAHLAVMIACPLFAQQSMPTAVSVTTFGAVGNGIANDARAIQTCINAVQAAGGGECDLPRGKYFTGSTTLTMPSAGVSLIGVNEQMTTIVYTGTETALVVGQSAARSDRHKLRNIRIDLSSAGPGAVGIRFTYTFWDELTSVDINTFNGGRNNGQRAITFDGGSGFGSFLTSRNLTVNGCFLYGLVFNTPAGGNALSVYTSSDFVGGSLVNNCVDKTGTVGIYIVAGDTNRFYGTDVEDWGTGALVAGRWNNLDLRLEGNVSYDWETVVGGDGNKFVGSFDPAKILDRANGTTAGALANSGGSTSGFTITGAQGTELDPCLHFGQNPNVAPDMKICRDFSGQMSVDVPLMVKNGLNGSISVAGSKGACSILVTGGIVTGTTCQ